MIYDMICINGMISSVFALIKHPDPKPQPAPHAECVNENASKTAVSGEYITLFAMS